MRFVFIDEAGTSSEEPIQIVAGVVVDADRQLMLAEAAIAEVNGGLPEEFRKAGGFFHAKDIWNDKVHKSAWTLSARLRHMKRMMSIPRRLGAPLVFSVVIKERVRETDLALLATAGVSHPLQEWFHIGGFHRCLIGADSFVRDYAGLSEVAVAVAENVSPSLQNRLRQMPLRMKKIGGLVLPPEHVEPTANEAVKGYTDQNEEARITRLRGAVHFVEKDDEPLLQLADACAFGLRRFFERAEFGADFAAAIFGSGNEPNRDDFTGRYDWVLSPFGAAPPAHLARGDASR